MFPLGLPHGFLCPTSWSQAETDACDDPWQPASPWETPARRGAVWWCCRRWLRAKGAMKKCLWSQQYLKVSTDRWSTQPVSLSSKCIARRVNASTIESWGWTNSMQTVIPGNTWQTCISVWTTNQGLFDFCWVRLDMIFVLKVIRMCLSGLTGLGNVSTAGNLGNLSVRADLFLCFTNCPRVNDNTY